MPTKQQTICPHCDAVMEHRTHEANTYNPPPEKHVTHAWVCPECPLICFEYVSDQDKIALLEMIK